MNEINEKGTKKIFSRIGVALCVIFLVSTVMQVVWVYGLGQLPGIGAWLTESSWGMWLGTFVPMYLIGVPVGLLIFKGIPGEAPQENKLGVGDFFVYLLISFFLMYAGNIIGNTLSAILSGGQAENALLDYAMDTNPLKVLVMVILAPLVEEYIFRKVIIDKTRRYGEKMAVFFSALTFGLFHMNLFQFFYAFALGWLLAYVYLRTGRLRYTALLHGIINFQGAVIAPAVLSLLDLEAMMNINPATAPEELLQILPGLLVYLLYAMALMGLSVVGLVVLILKCRKLEWREAQLQLSGDSLVKTVYGNAGMIAFAVLSLIFIILALF